MKLTLQKFAYILLFIFISFFVSAQKFHLVQDINTTTNSYPLSTVYFNNGYEKSAYTIFHGTAYFYANDGIHGNELWRSDGTTNGTFIVKDINPGTASSNPMQIIVFKNQLFFSADDGVHGVELWKSDGTANGTSLVKDLNPGSGSGYPRQMISYNNYIYFPATDSNGNAQFWNSDGTTAGTTLIKSFSDSIDYVYYPVLLSNHIYFFAATKINELQLWKVNNSKDDAIKIANIPDAFSISVASSNNTIYFDAEGWFGTSLWKSDGTSAGTKDISAFGYDFLQDFIIFRNELYFNDDTGIFKSDGTTSGTKSVIGQQSLLSSKIVLGNNIFFIASADKLNFTLWKNNGTDITNTAVKNFDSSLTFATYLQSAEDKLYFISYTLDSITLWKSNGTKNGTFKVKNFYRDGHYFPSCFTSVKTKILFDANDGKYGQELWNIDTVNNQITLFKDINTSYTSGSFPSSLTVFNNKLFFGAQTDLYGNELWKTDGTEKGTALVKNINAGIMDGVENYYSLGSFFNGYDKLYFPGNDETHGNEVWKTNGDSSTTSLIDDVVPGVESNNIYYFDNSPTQAALVNKRLYYVANGNYTPSTLYSTNGMPGSTKKIIENGGICLTPFGNKLAFVFSNFTDQLWITDSTAQSSKQITTAHPSANSSLMVYKGRLYYGATDGYMCKTDGTDANNKHFIKLNPYSYNGLDYQDKYRNVEFKISHAVVNDILYFAASDSIHGLELWKTDGSSTGTTLVKDINPGIAGSGLSSFVVIDSLIYFLANDGANGLELWKTNGTTSGTLMIKNITADKSSSKIFSLTSIEKKVIFLLFDSTNNSYILWKSDGTSSETKAVTDTSFNNIQITPPLRVIGNKIFFTATSAAYGSELWVGTLDGSFTPQQISFNGNLLNNTDAKLNWSTLNEQNLNKYNLQRSTDGIHFTTIKKEIATADNSLHKNYQYLDNNINQLNSNKIYYRLESIDEDGNPLVSNTVALQLKNNIKLVVQPNPVSSNFSLQVNGIEADQNLHVEIFNISGTKINDQTKMVRKGNADFNYNTALWSAGTYIARVTFADGTKQEVKITKQ